ncbi:MAG TPA: hypothetical protein VNM92_18280 [Thermoanaerobaculia bacterium]|nr:hypothetical protein [Thermoanaerobaculia bacterium]
MGKTVSASIAAKLDEPKEWVEEAAHLNAIMPALLVSGRIELRWIAVLPVEFSNPRVTTVGEYVFFVYVHLKSDAELAAAIAAFAADARALQRQQVTSEVQNDAVRMYLDSAAGE